MGHRGAALRRGGSSVVAGPPAAGSCPRSSWMAWIGRDHCRVGRALCAGGGGRAALCPGLRPGRAQSGVHAAVRRTDRRERFGREPVGRAKAGAFADSGRRSDHRRRPRLERAWSISRTLGDALFLVAAFLSACFTVAMRQAKLDPLHAAALVSTGSLAVYLPVYLAFFGTRLAQLPLADFAVQALFQGVVVTIVVASSLRPRGRPAWRFGRLGLWSSGAGAVGPVCNTAARRVAA